MLQRARAPRGSERQPARCSSTWARRRPAAGTRAAPARCSSTWARRRPAAGTRAAPAAGPSAPSGRLVGAQRPARCQSSTSDELMVVPGARSVGESRSEPGSEHESLVVDPGW